MIDYEKLKVLLEACKGQDDMNKFAQAVGSLFEECTIETIAAMVEERGRLVAQLCICPSCKGEGETYSGSNTWEGHFQPPEPIMEECGECGGDGVIGDADDLTSLLAERDQLKAENDALRKDASIQVLLCCNLCRCAIQPANQLQAEIDRLKADIEVSANDARRYQWLRDKSESVHQFYMSTPIWFTGVTFSPENVDRTIDAAMDWKPQ